MAVYADNAATTAVSKRALEAAMPFLTEACGNPSSPHAWGRQAAAAVLAARQTLAERLGAKRAGEVYFTSCGSEADTWAVAAGTLYGAQSGRRHILTTAVEHHAVLGACENAREQGFEVTYLRPDSSGVITAEAVISALRDDTCLLSIMAANNETGVIMPYDKLGAACREKGVLLHVDAVQGFGHLPVDVSTMGIDLLSVSGHKLCAPKGVGALYCRSGVSLPKLIFGGQQERGRRAGTENVPAIAALGAAVEELFEDNEAKNARLCRLRDRLREGLLELEGAALNGFPEGGLPGIVNVSFEGIEGESLLLLLDMQGIAASSGSACASGSAEPSHVLRAMGRTKEQAAASVRFSLGFQNTEADVEEIIAACRSCVERLRRLRG
ncbi:MAG: cysteine desulfurase [Ruminococcus sp.]|nr:cysteine desulfurase [Ruminococcus sp.]